MVFRVNRLKFIITSPILKARGVYENDFGLGFYIDPGFGLR